MTIARVPHGVRPVRRWLLRRPPLWLRNLPFIALHLACLAACFSAPDGRVLGLAFLTYVVRMFGITAGYHRYFSHRAYKTSRPFQLVLAVLGCSALQKGPLWWAAHHRHHHRHADTDRDPHSPWIRTLWWSHVGWILAATYEPTDWNVVRDWQRYPELRWLNRYHWLPGMALAVACYVFAGWAGLVWGFVVSTVLLYHAVFTVNSLCHLVGRRRYPTPDESRNNLLVAVLTLGEGWHNNHHHCQSAARQGFRWWEIDVSFYLIKLLAAAGLVWGVREVPRQPGAGGRTPDGPAVPPAPSLQGGPWCGRERPTTARSVAPAASTATALTPTDTSFLTGANPGACDVWASR